MFTKIERKARLSDDALNQKIEGFAENAVNIKISRLFWPVVFAFFTVFATAVGTTVWHMHGTNNRILGQLEVQTLVHDLTRRQIEWLRSENRRLLEENEMLRLSLEGGD